MNKNTAAVTLAVVIPNYNDSRFLSDCLNSILNQKVYPDQIIFVDDQSTDDSLKKARLMLQHVPGAKIVETQSNVGTMGALNEGLKHVTSDYALFLSSNDYLADEFFELAKSSLAGAPAKPGVWSAMAWTVEEDGKRKSVFPSPVISFKEKYFSQEECIRLASMFGTWFMGATVLYHRETLETIGGFPENSKGLADMFAALTLASLKGAMFFPRPLAVWRLHSGGCLYETLSEWENLEKILNQAIENGKKQAPKLFTKRFCKQIKHRARFSAIRAFKGSELPSLNDYGWKGTRYKILKCVFPVLRNNKVRTIISLILIRPSDIFNMIFYRVIKFTWINLTRIGTNKKTPV